jgi:hypothetical protein
MGPSQYEKTGFSELIAIRRSRKWADDHYQMIIKTSPAIHKHPHYLRKKSFEPVLSLASLKAELERRRKLSDIRSELEERLRSFRSLLPR